jgi:hypothetical protein
VATPKILVDFEDVFKTPTGIPITTMNDVLAILNAGFEVGLWFSKVEKIAKIEQWIATENRFPKGFRLSLIPTRPSNSKLWILQFFGIKINTPKFEIFYGSLFPAVFFKHEVKRIIRMHDPFNQGGNLLSTLTEPKARFKLKLANFLRSIALNRVASKSYFVFNSQYTEKRARKIHSRISSSAVIYPLVQFPPNSEKKDLHNRVFPYWLIIGSQRQRKRPATIVNLWAESSLSTRSNILVIGSIPESELNSAALEAKREERLRFQADLSSNEIHAAICASIGTIFYSLGEGWGLPIAESITCGKLTICNNLPVFYEVAGDNAEYFGTNNPSQAIGVMSRGLNGDFDAPHLTRARIQFSQRYQLESLSESWLQVVSDLHN